jgi:hypothetical protein
MKNLPVPSSPPSESKILPLLPGVHFHDAWQVRAGEPSLSALGQFLKAVAAAPNWVNQLMNVRNRVVALVGLKDLGTLPTDKTEQAYKPGQRVGIFTLISMIV